MKELLPLHAIMGRFSEGRSEINELVVIRLFEMQNQLFIIKNELAAKEKEVTELKDQLLITKKEIVEARKSEAKSQKQNENLKIFIRVFCSFCIFIIAFFCCFPSWYNNWNIIAPTLGFFTFLVTIMTLCGTLFSKFFP